MPLLQTHKQDPYQLPRIGNDANTLQSILEPFLHRPKSTMKRSIVK